jgi:hypothetical protein
MAPEEGLAGDPPDGDFTDYGVNPEVSTEDDNVSTFALDVDTASYAVTRDNIEGGFLPDEAAVRTEEIVNYLPQDYDAPEEGLGVHLDGTSVPFLDGADRRVLRVGVQAADDGQERMGNDDGLFHVLSPIDVDRFARPCRKVERPISATTPPCTGSSTYANVSSRLG